MNFLGHSYFKGASPLFLVGNVCGDFYKGLPDRLSIPDDMIEGVRFHRKLDSLTDSTRAVAVARKKLSSYGLFAGIIIDMYYDHFLAVHWNKFSDIPLEEHSDKVYSHIKTNKDLIPLRSQRTVDFMIAEDWLSSYRDIEFLERSLRGISRRISRKIDLSDSIELLKEDYYFFEENFFDFWRELNNTINLLK